jgi:hypothetical protein
VDYSPEGRTKGRIVYWLWWLDYLEASIRASAKWIFDHRGVRIHDPVSKMGRYFDLVWAWAILGLVSTTGGAALAIITQWRP